MAKSSINWQKRLSGREAGAAVRQPVVKKQNRPAKKTQADDKRAKGFTNSVLRLSIIAMLIAMEIVLNRFLSINTAGWKIGFAFIPPTVAAILFGPLESAVVYALSDFIGAILFPIGQYHPGFTICAALMGLVAGFFLNKKPLERIGVRFEWRKIRFFPNIIVPVFINCILIGLVINTYWVSMLYGSKTYYGWFIYRLPEYAVLVPVQLILIPALLKLCELLKKAGLVNGRRVKQGRKSEARI